MNDTQKLDRIRALVNRHIPGLQHGIDATNDQVAKIANDSITGFQNILDVIDEDDSPNKPVEVQGCREETQEEVLDTMFGDIAMKISHWAQIEDLTVRQKLEGLVHSIMSMLDGRSSVPCAFDIVTRPHPNDAKSNQEEGENWIPDGMVINDGMLHELITKYFHNRQAILNEADKIIIKLRPTKGANVREQKLSQIRTILKGHGLHDLVDVLDDDDEKDIFHRDPVFQALGVARGAFTDHPHHPQVAHALFQRIVYYLSKTPEAASELFFVQDSRDVVGNCMSWWAKDGNGYTCSIEKAGRFTYDQVRVMRDSDVPWPVSYVLANTVTHARADSRAFMNVRQEKRPNAYTQGLRDAFADRPSQTKSEDDDGDKLYHHLPYEQGLYDVGYEAGDRARQQHSR